MKITSDFRKNIKWQFDKVYWKPSSHFFAILRESSIMGKAVRSATSCRIQNATSRCSTAVRQSGSAYLHTLTHSRIKDEKVRKYMKA